MKGNDGHSDLMLIAFESLRLMEKWTDWPGDLTAGPGSREALARYECKSGRVACTVELLRPPWRGPGPEWEIRLSCVGGEKLFGVDFTVPPDDFTLDMANFSNRYLLPAVVALHNRAVG